MIGTPWLIAGGLAGAIAAGFLGHMVGVDRTEAHYQRLELARLGAEQRQRRQDFAAADRASVGHEAARQAIQARERRLRGQIHAALSAPSLQCPAVPLADIVVPAAAVRGLRDAAAGGGAP